MVLLPFIRAIHIAATYLIAGAFAFEFLILRRSGLRSDSSAAQVSRRWLRLLRMIGLTLGLLSWAAWLAMLAIEMSGLPPAQALSADVLQTVVTRTKFGHVWSLRLGLFAVIAAQLLWVRRARGQTSVFVDVLMAAMSVVLVSSLAWTGHALGTHPAHLLVDAIHLLAAALWLGMLPPFWLVIRRGTSTTAWSEFATAAASSFFVPGVLAVTALALTGVANSLWLVDSAADLLTTRYGVLLVSKVSLFGVMLVLAALNRALARRLNANTLPGERLAELRVLRRNVVAELVFGMAVLALVGTLGVTAPATHEHSMHEMHDM